MLTAITDSLKFEVMNWSSRISGPCWRLLSSVIFQPELRRAFAQLGSTSFGNRATRQKEAIEDVVNAVVQMSLRRIGALIVFERRIGLATIINSAVLLDTKLNSLLIQSIFYPNSPLHDGAVIIKDDRIAAAHAILPLAQQTDGSAKTLGTRHRAALGITDETDSVVVVVSEETGAISVAYRGHLKRDVSSDKLHKLLSELLIADEGEYAKSVFGLDDDRAEAVSAFSDGGDSNANS
jgi:diadenylate cyclase